VKAAETYNTHVFHQWKLIHAARIDRLARTRRYVNALPDGTPFEQRHRDDLMRIMLQGK
jgi:hypothetical protein